MIERAPSTYLFSFSQLNLPTMPSVHCCLLRFIMHGASDRTRKHRADDGRHNIFRIENAENRSESKLNETATQSPKRRETRPLCSTSARMRLLLSCASAL